MCHIQQTSNTNCRQVFDGYVQLALQSQDPAFLAEDDPPSLFNNLSMEDLGVFDEDLPQSDAADVDMILDEDREHLPGIDSDGAEIEEDFQVAIEDEDIEVASMPDTDDENEDEEYLW